MSSWETGYGDFEMKPDFDTLRLVPWHEGTAMCMADLQWHGDKPVAASPRQILRRQLDRLAERGWTAFAATELEFIVFRDTYEQAFHKRYQDLEPGNLYNVDYSMLGTSRLEPLIGRIRREMAKAGPAGGELQGRVQLRPARDQLHLRERAARRRHAHDLQERRQGDRLPGGHGDHVHGQVRRARGQLVPHPPLRARRGRHAGVRRAARAVRPLPRRPARVPARADAVQGAQRQLLQALRRGLVRPDGGRVGPRQPHLLDARDRRGPLAARREPAGGRRREPLPRDRGDDRLRPARDRQRARARAGAGGQRLHRRTSRTSRARCTTRASCSRAAPSRARRSGRTSSTTTSTTPTWSCAPSRRP